eukprot:TRINITY_DN63_c0_g1_i7.p1 TRINITY_DN63_c0_g1~~TRINITY_DN63_c0_g1_i7.p1  ORF type:complete len:240 (+),score=-32.25 TRINITY_DN63_c0_g1_i7:267-986(+)
MYKKQYYQHNLTFFRNIQLQLIYKLFPKSLFINTTKDCKVPYIELIMIKTLQFYITTFPKYSIISLPKRNHILFNQVINAQIKKSNTQVKLNITKVREIIIQQNVYQRFISENLQHQTIINNYTSKISLRYNKNKCLINVMNVAITIKWTLLFLSQYCNQCFRKYNERQDLNVSLTNKYNASQLFTNQLFNLNCSGSKKSIVTHFASQFLIQKCQKMRDLLKTQEILSIHENSTKTFKF